MTGEQQAMDWGQMSPGDFGQTERPVQQALFAEPDACGTPDLFDQE